jgi:hypothetical protein
MISSGGGIWSSWKSRKGMEWLCLLMQFRNLEGDDDDDDDCYLYSLEPTNNESMQGGRCGANILYSNVGR